MDFLLGVQLHYAINREKIGTEGSKSLNRMKVVIDEYGKVVTAYPIK